MAVQASIRALRFRRIHTGPGSVVRPKPEGTIVPTQLITFHTAVRPNVPLPTYDQQGASVGMFHPVACPIVPHRLPGRRRGSLGATVVA